jgi:hypothetical protein
VSCVARFFVNRFSRQEHSLTWLAQKLRNATNGSWWIVKVHPTWARGTRNGARSAPEEKFRNSGDKKKLVNCSSGALRAFRIMSPYFVGWT